MSEFSTTVKVNTLISMFHFLLHNYMAHLSNVLKICYPMKLIYYVENIKSTNFFLGTNTKSTKLRIHELVIFYFVFYLRIYWILYYNLTQHLIEK
jgi:hypothetical protein